MPYSVLHDELLLPSLHWDEIEDVHLLPMEPRRDFWKHRPLKLDSMGSTMFYRSFRFQKLE